eukprot:Nitzschia sp. Nitz4//scaffold69_size99277//93385//94475//NITZ4_004651-RA/size99277-processed-gene-0.28-mRNA-1//1//CDS//3329556769//5794//frame0
MSSLKDWVRSTTRGPWVRLMDGGVSTHLERLLQQQDPNASFPIRALWSSSLLLSPPGQEVILQGHKDWLKAGSDILTTVTYQCHYGVPTQPEVVPKEQMKGLIQSGVALAKQAIEQSPSDRPSFVVASSGCFGAALADGSEYTGNYGDATPASIMEFHRSKAESFLKCQPDGLAIETIPSVEETSIVCEALKSLAVDQSSTFCWVSMACHDGETLNEGKPLVEALDAVRSKDPHGDYVHAIGVNCCDSALVSTLLENLTRHMAQHGPRRGIVVYPNSGEEWNAENETWVEGTGCTDCMGFSDRLVHAVDVVSTTWEANHGEGPMPKSTQAGGSVERFECTIYYQSQS